MDIARQIPIEAPPARVSSALARSPYRPGMRVIAAGAGAQVLFEACVDPDSLAEAIDADVMSTVHEVKRHLEGIEDQLDRRPTNQRNRTMTTIRQSVEIDAEPARVWESLSDFGNVAVWNPTVKRSQLTSDQGGGLGATRQCELLPMGTIQERITSWDEGHRLGVEIYERKMVPGLRRADAVIEVHPLGSATEVTMTIDYSVGLGAIGAGMNAMAMKRRFTKAVTGLLAGLKHHVETGESVDNKTDIPVRAVARAA